MWGPLRLSIKMWRLWVIDMMCHMWRSSVRRMRFCMRSIVGLSAKVWWVELRGTDWRKTCIWIDSCQMAGCRMARCREARSWMLRLIMRMLLVRRLLLARMRHRWTRIGGI